MTLAERLLKDREIERITLSDPHDMLCVIQEVISCIGVNKHIYVPTIDQQPGNHLSELFSRYGELAAPYRMRADRPLVKCSYLDGVMSIQRVSETSCIWQGLSAIVEVSVVISD